MDRVTAAPFHSLSWAVDMLCLNLGDLTLEFSNGVRFESFTADSLKCEEWRLVDYLTGEQLVTFEE